VAEKLELADLTCEHGLGDLADYAGAEIQRLVGLILETHPVKRNKDVFCRGVAFKNATFEMCPDLDCGCGAVDDPETDHHSTGCAVLAPNFRCENVVIGWHEKICTNMTSNRPDITREELAAVFRCCQESLRGGNL